MTETVTERRKEVSQIHRENSRQVEERSSMSAADDVLEMEGVCSELADRLAEPGSKAKARIAVVSREIGVSWNRALEFLSGKARRVDAWEKEHAKRRIAELRAAERRRLENEYLDWLADDLGRLTASGAKLPRQLVDELQHAVRTARGEAGAMALSPSTDADADYDQREFSED